MIKVEYFTFNPFAENTYVLSNEKGQALIIDPGCYFTEEEKTLKEFIHGTGLPDLKPDKDLINPATQIQSNQIDRSERKSMIAVIIWIVCIIAVIAVIYKIFT